MAKKYNNSKGFLVIEMTYAEATEKCGFGIKVIDKETEEIIRHNLHCDSCNELMTDKCYYVAVINRLLCKDCCDDFLNCVDRDDSDIPYEVRHYNIAAKLLGLEPIS